MRVLRLLVLVLLVLVLVLMLVLVLVLMLVVLVVLVLVLVLSTGSFGRAARWGHHGDAVSVGVSLYVWVNVSMC